MECRLCNAMVPMSLGFMYLGDLTEAEVDRLCKAHLLGLVRTMHRLELAQGDGVSPPLDVNGAQNTLW